MKIPSIFSQHRRIVIAGIAVLGALGITFAITTYAAPGKVVYQTTGDQAQCTPVHAGYECTPGVGETASYWSANWKFNTKLRPGTYRLAVKYRSYGVNVPPTYEHDLTIKVNGRKVDTGSTPYQAEGAEYIGEEFKVRQAVRTITIDWTNDFYAASLADANLAITGIALERITHKEPDKKYPRGSSQYWANKILEDAALGDKARISLTSEARRELMLARQGKPAYSPQVKTYTKLDRRLLKSLYAVSRTKKFRIWQFTSGGHVPCSNHFEGRAADLQNFDGSWPRSEELLRHFRKRGANELLGRNHPNPVIRGNHQNHVHIGWHGPNPKGAPGCR
jgi:hypothetical protein